ncbi:hypothetical protein SEA_ROSAASANTEWAA_27 [Streptomyces phage RosaAsantewaa]|nr:hypothetical protein SEA_ROSAASANTEWAA_27 [Streptomyces phage RosaAsantewaa]
MFNRRNRALQVTMVKTPKSEDATETEVVCTHKDPEKIAEIAKDFVTHTAKAAGAVILTYAVSTAIVRIADNLTKNNDSE